MKGSKDIFQSNISNEFKYETCQDQERVVHEIRFRKYVLEKIKNKLIKNIYPQLISANLSIFRNFLNSHYCFNNEEQMVYFESSIF